MSAEVRVTKFVQLVLAHAQKDDATELVVGRIDGETTPIRCKIKGQWYDQKPPPAHLRTPIVTELALLAELPEGPFPKEGTIEVVTDNVSTKWKLSAPTAEGDWVLTRKAE